MRFCVGLFVWVCLCVSEGEEDDEGEKKYELVLQMQKRERKKGAKWEINKIIGYTATVTVYICTVTIANV